MKIKMAKIVFQIAKGDLELQSANLQALCLQIFLNLSDA